MIEKDEKFMGIRMRGVLLMLLCTLMSCSGNWNREMAVKNENFYLYMDAGESMEINYISYSVVVRGNGDKGNGKEEITVVRVVRR